MLRVRLGKELEVGAASLKKLRCSGNVGKEGGASGTAVVSETAMV